MTDVVPVLLKMTPLSQTPIIHHEWSTHKDREGRNPNKQIGEGNNMEPRRKEQESRSYLSPPIMPYHPPPSTPSYPFLCLFFSLLDSLSSAPPARLPDPDPALDPETSTAFSRFRFVSDPFSLAVSSSRPAAPAPAPAEEAEEAEAEVAEAATSALAPLAISSAATSPSRRRTPASTGLPAIASNSSASVPAPGRLVVWAEREG